MKVYLIYLNEKFVYCLSESEHKVIFQWLDKPKYLQMQIENFFNGIYGLMTDCFVLASKIMFPISLVMFPAYFNQVSFPHESGSLQLVNAVLFIYIQCLMVSCLYLLVCQPKSLKFRNIREAERKKLIARWLDIEVVDFSKMAIELVDSNKRH